MAAQILHSRATGLRAAKVRCLACEATNAEMSREHFWPQWLIKKTKTKQTGVRWFGGERISPLSATIPLCKRCNNQFGHELEAPVMKIFEAIENGKGISDFEAELLVRWMWKFEGYAWLLQDDPLRTYSNTTKLKDRVLNRISLGREEVSLAIALIETIDPSFGDSPLGIDSENECNCIFISGVFSRIAIIVCLTKFTGLLPQQYSVYTLNDSSRSPSEHARMFYPKIGFPNDVKAVGMTKMISERLARLHDDLARSSTR